MASISPASAHDEIVGGSPEPDSTVTDVPESIELENSATPQDSFNTVALSLDGDQIVSGEPTVDGSTLALDIPGNVDLSDGEYTVGYQVTSSDGHPIRGSYTFTLDTGEGASDSSGDNGQGESAGDSADTADSSDEDDDGLPSWTGPLLGIAGVIVVLGALIMAIARYRNLGNDGGDGDDRDNKDDKDSDGSEEK